MQLNEFTFHAPQTVSDAVKILISLKAEGVRINAGGTFLINMLKGIKTRGAKSPQHVLSLRRIPELKKIELRENILTIGTMVTMRDLMDSDVVAEKIPVLKDVASSIGNTPIRNMATVGGNLTCRYAWTEMPAVMIVSGANLHFQEEQEKVVGAEEFFQGAARAEGILTRISIPVKPGWTFGYQRATKTAAQDIPILSVCVGGQMEKGKIQDVRVGINNGVGFAQRDTDLESYLKSANSLDAVLSEDLPGMDQEMYTSRSDEYKLHMFSVCIKRALKRMR